MSAFPPDPTRGLDGADFRRVGPPGLGDGYNGYVYSMAWFKDHIFVGTSRANLILLKLAMPFVKMDVWPVEVVVKNYSPEFEHGPARGEIWRYAPLAGTWTRVYQAPLVTDAEGVEFSRDLGYRAMMVFQGRSDAKPALYVSTWSRSRGTGPDILRTEDGVTFETLPKPRFMTNGQAITFNAIRVLIPFKGRLYTAPVGASKGNVNVSGVSYVYETDDPASGNWRCVNGDGFGTFPEVANVYEIVGLGDYLYAGTGGKDGFQIWRTTAEGEPPYHWEKVLDRGAGRGGLNQGSVALYPFKGALYIGTGIQNGGYDWRYNIGPAAAEIIRLEPNGQWDIIMGNARDGRQPLSGLYAGFNNYFCGYLWRMGVHDGWLYAGTMDWSVILRYTDLASKPTVAARLMDKAGIEDMLKLYGGFDLWRTWDGENWLPVTRNGFDNEFNYGCRNIITTPHGLFIGTANPFGPRVAVKAKDGTWAYQDNPRGGLEVLLGRRPPAAPAARPSQTSGRPAALYPLRKVIGRSPSSSSPSSSRTWHHARGRSGPPLPGSSVRPIRCRSTARAASRPSEMAHTMSDWPRRASPAAKMPGTLVR